jgi:hypothetical protein
MQGSVKRAGTETNRPAAHPRRVLKDGVTVARLVRKAEKDQQDRFGDWRGVHISLGDMSSDDMLNRDSGQVKEKNIGQTRY